MEAAALVAPVIVTIRDRGYSRELAEDLWVYAEIFAVSSALNITVKTLVQRPIPRLYTGIYPHLEKKASSYRSFYSGHVAQTTGALVANDVMSRLRGRKRGWPWILAAIGTAAISLARGGAGRHFYSDVVAGALAGALVGSLLPILHPARRSSDGMGTPSAFKVLPRSLKPLASKERDSLGEVAPSGRLCRPRRILAG